MEVKEAEAQGIIKRPDDERIKEAIRQVEATKEERSLVKTPEELTELMGWVQYFMKSKGHNFKDKYDLLLVMKACRDIGMPLSFGISSMYIVNGRVKLHSEGVLAPVLKSGLMAWYDQYPIDDNGERIGRKNLKAPVYGAVFECKRVDSDNTREEIFTIDDAKTAKLWGSKDNWVKYPKRMLIARARTHCLAYTFPEVLLGYTDYEEAGRAPRDVTPIADLKQGDLEDLTKDMVGK